MKYRFSRFTLDPAARLLENDGGGVQLPRRAFDCLAYLLEHRERAISRDELARRIWNRQDVSDNQIAQTITAIRRSLDDKEHRLLRTVPAFGYHWTCPVEIEDAPVATPEKHSAHMTESAALISPGLTTAVNAETATNFPPAPYRGTQTARRALWPAALLVVSATAIALGVVDRLNPRERLADTESTGIGHEITQDAVWILPTDMPDQDEHAWARIGLMALISERLRRHGIAVAPIENVLIRFPTPTENELATRSVFEETGAGTVVQIRLDEDRGAWRIALSAQRRDGERIIVHGSGSDFFAAAEPAADALARRLGGRVKDAVAAVEQNIELIRQTVHAGDIDGARAQLARLPGSERDSIDAGLIEVLIDTELSRLDSASARIERLLEQARHNNDETALAQVLMARMSLARKARQPLWHADVDQAVELAERSQIASHIASAVTLRGIRERYAGRYDAALRDFTRARQAWLDAGDPLGAASAMAELGRVSQWLGHAPEALERLSRSAEVYRRYGASLSEFSAILSMTTIQIAMLRWDDALASSDRARVLLPYIEDPIKRAAFKRQRANVLASLGRLQEAAAEMDEVEHELRRTDLRDELRIIRSADRAPILLQMGHPEAALEISGKSFEILFKMNEKEFSDYYRLIQSPDSALWNWMQARAAVRALRPDRVIAPTAAHLTALQHAASPLALIARADWLLENDDIKGAEAAYRQALTAAEQSNHLSRIRAATEALVVFLLSERRLGEAQQWFDALYARDPETLDRDFPTAQLRLRMRWAHGDRAGWKIALLQATRLAGERVIPPSLLRPPTLPAPEPVGGAVETAPP